jgi:hypothetical protein
MCLVMQKMLRDRCRHEAYVEWSGVFVKDLDVVGVAETWEPVVVGTRSVHRDAA